ncbi:MAG: hypothetical protein ABI068_03795 [Ktedonobacterales bacterium]
MGERDILNAQSTSDVDTDTADDQHTADNVTPQMGVEGGKGGAGTMGGRIGDATSDSRRKLGGIGGEGGIGSHSDAKHESDDETGGHTASEAGWPG